MEDETKKDSDENVPWLPGNETQKELIRVVKTKRMKSLWILPGKTRKRSIHLQNVSCLRKPKRVENLKGPSRHPLVKRYMNYCEKNWRRPCWRIEYTLFWIGQKSKQAGGSYESCERLLKAGKAELVIVAEDASQNTKKSLLMPAITEKWI